MDISKLGILILKLYRFKDDTVIDQITDEFLKVVENTGAGSEDSTLSHSDPDPGFSPAMKHLIDKNTIFTISERADFAIEIETAYTVCQILRFICFLQHLDHISI